MGEFADTLTKIFTATPLTAYFISYFIRFHTCGSDLGLTDPKVFRSMKIYV